MNQNSARTSLNKGKFGMFMWPVGVAADSKI